MLGLPNVVQAQPVHRFIAGPRRGSSRQPQILGGRGQLHPFQGISKEKSRAPGSGPHDYTQDLAVIQAPVLLIRGRYDRMVAFEVGIAILNHIADWHLVLLNKCGHRPPFEKPAQVLAFPAGLLRGTGLTWVS
jgi:pimeloyl-ACP methyl ester carboxylesterase